MDVVDIKPKNALVTDIKPLNVSVVDVKPKMTSDTISQTDQLYTRTLGAGMYLGIPILTYPVAITGVISSKS